MYELAIVAIIIALIFDFVNGFNDSANSVATVIGTRVLKTASCGCVICGC